MFRIAICDNNKKLWIIIPLILITVCICIMVVFYPEPSIDVPTLIEKSLSEQYEKDTEIEIFDTYKIIDYEIVGFTIVGSEKCSFAVVKQDENSRYELISVARSEKLINRALDIFYEYITLYDDEYELGAEMYIVVVSMNDELAKIKMTLEDNEPYYKEVYSSPSLTILEYPIGTSTAEFLFYDKSGLLIN